MHDLDPRLAEYMTEAQIGYQAFTWSVFFALHAQFAPNLSAAFRTKKTDVVREVKMLAHASGRASGSSPHMGGAKDPP